MTAELTRTTDFAAARRIAAPSGAPARFASVSGLPDVMRPAGPVEEIDRAMHHVALAPPMPATASADAAVAPVSVPLPVTRPETRIADGPIPGTVPASPYDPHRPLQLIPGPAPRNSIPPPDLDAALVAAQIATVARSNVRLDRAKGYADRLGSHLAEIQTKLAAVAEHSVAAAISRADLTIVNVEAVRGEMVEVQRQHRQALAILSEVEAEHARHEADLAALCGSDGLARGKLKEAHEARALAKGAADDASDILDRAKGHAEAVDGKLAAARAAEARYDADATARLREALTSGEAPPEAAEPFVRASAGLEDDLRTARLMIDRLTAEHRARTDDLAKADLVMAGAIDGVLCAEAEAVARELQAADARASALRVRLHSYANKTAGDYVAPKPVPPKALSNGMYEHDAAYALAMSRPPRTVPHTSVIGHALASGPLPPHQGPFTINWTNEAAAWTAYAAALSVDPQAEPGFADAAAVPPSPPFPIRAA